MSSRPSLLRTVKFFHGSDSASKLAMAFGGRRLRVPLATSPRLTEALGIPLASWLCEHHGGTRVYVSRATAEREVVSAERVMGLTADGKSAAEIAADLGICERTVHRHRQRARKIAMRHPSIKPIPIAATITRRDPQNAPVHLRPPSSLIH